MDEAATVDLFVVAEELSENWLRSLIRPLSCWTTQVVDETGIGGEVADVVADAVVDVETIENERNTKFRPLW